MVLRQGKTSSRELPLNYTPLNHQDHHDHNTECSRPHVNADSVLHWLETCPVDEGAKIMQELARRRQHLFDRIDYSSMIRDSHLDRGERSSMGSMGSMAESPDEEEFRDNRTRATTYGDKADLREYGSDPVLQFMEHDINTDDRAVAVEVGIIRRVTSAARCTVRWSTKAIKHNDDLEGKIYDEQSGKVDFEPGESFHSIQIELKPGAVLSDRTRTFGIELSDPEGGLLDNRQSFAYIHVMQTNTYPSERQSELFCDNHLHSHDQMDKINALYLVWDYVVRVWRHDGIKWNTVVRAMALQVSNVTLFCKLFLMTYLMDYVFKPAVDGGTHTGLLTQNLHGDGHEFTAIVVCQVTPLFFIMFDQIANIHKLKYSCGGVARKNLILALFDKVLNLADQRDTRTGELFLAMTSDVPHIVSKAYINVINCVEQLGKLLVLYSFTLVAPPVFGKPFVPASLILSFLYPVTYAFVFWFRWRQTATVLRKFYEAQSSFADFVTEMVHRVDLTLHYKEVLQALGFMQEPIKQYNGTRREAVRVLIANAFLGYWITEIFVVAAYLYCGHKFLSHRMTLGMLVANVHVFKEFGHAWARIYNIVTDMLEVTPALERVARILAQVSDLPRRGKVSQLCNSMENHFVRSDQMEGSVPILVKVNAIERSSGVRQSRPAEIGLRIQQGQLICIITRKHVLSNSIKNIFSGLADRRFEFADAPRHLRILFVQNHDKFFSRQTLYENLTFGGDAEGTRKRVSLVGLNRAEAVCKKLGVSDRHLKQLRSDTKEQWDTVLSIEQSVLLSIARALIADPDVLCYEEPVTLLRDIRARRVLQVLREFVENRGVGFAEEKWGERRVKTVIYTSLSMLALKSADNVVAIDQHGFGSFSLDKPKDLHEVEQIMEGRGDTARHDSLDSSPIALTRPSSSNTIPLSSTMSFSSPKTTKVPFTASASLPASASAAKSLPLLMPPRGSGTSQKVAPLEIIF